MINKFSRIQKIIFAGAIAVSLFFLFSQTITGERIYFPGWAIEKIKDFLSENELSAKDYKNGTIILIKPVATGVGEGRYEAGDIVEIRDGEELYKRFGEGNFLGREEQRKLLPLYYPGKLTEEEKQKLIQPASAKASAGKSESKKRRQYGVDYTQVLSEREILKIRNAEKLNRIPEINLSQILKKSSDQHSVANITKHLAEIEKARNTFKKIIAKIIPFAYAGTGGTKTICTSGCDYTTLNLWEAGEQGILATPAIAQITEGFLDTTAVTIDGWTTSEANYIYVYTTAAARHDGKWSANAYKLSVAATDTVIKIADFYVRIDGLQIEATGTDTTVTAVEVYFDSWLGTDPSEFRISNCIVKNSIPGNAYSGISVEANRGLTGKIWNNIVYDFSSGYGFWFYSGTSYFYNNTVQNCSKGFHHNTASDATGAMVVKNSLAQNCGDGFSGTMSASSDYNLSDLADDAPGSYSRNLTNVTFIDKDNDDFHLASNDAGAKDQWGNVYADANLAVTTDIDGDARPNGLLGDIGADECHLTPSPASEDGTPKTRIKGNVRIKGGVEFR